MSSRSQIADVRIYAGRWLVCDVLLEGQAKWSWTYCHGRAGYLSGPEWVTRQSESEPHWLQWLFDAPEAAQQQFVIAPDGSTIEWPGLGRTLPVEQLLERSRLQGFNYRWKQRSLRTEASREELTDCWTDLDKWQLCDLRPDGSCAMKILGRGGPAGSDMPGTFTWTFESSRRFQVNHQYAEPQVLKDTRLAEALEMPPVHGALAAYEIMRFDGKVLELLETRDNDFVVLGPVPTWWQKAKRPRDWPANV